MDKLLISSDTTNTPNGDCEYSTVGTHVIAELNTCDYELLKDKQFIETIVKAGVEKSGASIIQAYFHNFAPEGVSGVILLSESHASIHTWPDKGYASIDIYTCGEHVSPHIAYEYIASQLKAQSTKITTLTRGIDQGNQVYTHN